MLTLIPCCSPLPNIRADGEGVVFDIYFKSIKNICFPKKFNCYATKLLFEFWFEVTKTEACQQNKFLNCFTENSQQLTYWFFNVTYMWKRWMDIWLIRHRSCWYICYLSYLAVWLCSLWWNNQKIENKGGRRAGNQRWKSVQILQIYLCYFSLAVLIFWPRKLAKDTVLLALC